MIFKKKLGNILSGFNKIQKDLEGFVAQGVEDLGVNEVKIAQLESKRKDMREGMEKANKVYANLNKLLGD